MKTVLQDMERNETALVRTTGIRYKGKIFQSEKLIPYIGDSVDIVSGKNGEIDVFKDGKWICVVTSSLD